MKNQIEAVQTGLLVSSATSETDFFQGKFPEPTLWRRIGARFVRIRYTLRLYVCREAALLLTLSENYEKVLPRTPSKLIAYAVKNWKPLNRVTLKAARMLQK